MRKYLVLIVFVVAITFSASAMAEGLDAKIDLYGDLYRAKGETENSISGSNFIYVGDQGTSVLEYPIDTWFYRLGVHGNFLKNVDLSFDYAWSINDDPGTITDKDYTSAVLGTTPVITGKSTADLSANEWNLDFKYAVTEMEVQNEIMDKVRFLLGIGHKRQKFEYDAKNLMQSSVIFGDSTVPGKVSDYEIEYKITYLSLYLDFLNSAKNMKFLIGAEYAPNAEANDKLDLLLRSKITEAEADGTYTKFAVKAHWNVWENLFASVYYNFIKLDLDGTEDQRWYDGSGAVINNISYDNNSEQSIWGAQLSWLF